MIKLCKQCNINIVGIVDRPNRTSFCSHMCYWNSMKGVSNPEHSKRMKGHPAPNKGIPCLESTKEKLRQFNLGKKQSEEIKNKKNLKLMGRIPWNKNKKMSLDFSIKQSERMKGEKHWNYQGGINSINDTIRKSFEYKLWREAVFKRDDYTCQECKIRGGKLEADHIKPFSLFPELRLAIDNGQTLCHDCHVKTDTWGFKIYHYKLEHKII